MSMKKTTVKLETDYIKLDSLLKFAGIADSGGMAKEMILSGEIKVNGETCLLRGKKIKTADVVETDDMTILVE